MLGVKLLLFLYVYIKKEEKYGKMKKFILLTMLFFAGITVSLAQARMQFDKVSHDFGTFSVDNPVQKCTFTFTNKGDKPLVVNQAVASCGCTVAEYTKTPVQPGKQGTVTVTYDGKGKFPGHFKKTVTIRCNGVPEMTRLYIEGVMKDTEAKK